MSVIWHYMRPAHWYHVGWADLAVVLGAILVLIRPHNGYFLLITAGALILVFLMGLPESAASNHWSMHFFVSLTLSASFIISAAKQKSANIDVDAWLCVFRPAVCLLVVTLYLFASLHKLNSTYISEQGFAPTIYRSIISNEQLLAFSQLFPTDAAFIAILPLLSVLIELAIPILLLFRRTRLIAILIGMSFHIILSLRSYPFVTDFPIFLGAAYVLFLPAASVDLINVSILDRLRSSGLYELIKGLMAPAILLAVVFVPALYALPERRTIWWFTFANLKSVHWDLYAVSYIALIMFLIVKLRPTDYGSSPLMFRSAHYPLLPIIVLALFVGMSPYLGLKTAGAFTMFSQLETEGDYSNHWFMPLELQIFDYQKQVCVIETTAEDIPATASTGALLTYHQFRKMTRNNPEASITYTFKGERFELKRIADKPELVADPDLFERFYLAFQHTDWDRKTTYCDGKW